MKIGSFKNNSKKILNFMLMICIVVKKWDISLLFDNYEITM